MISTGCLVPTFRMAGREIDELVAKLDPVVDRFLFVTNDHDPVLRKHVSDRESNRISALYLDFPVGKAEAIRRGLMKILQEDYDIVLQVDGHQKQDAAQVPALLDELVHSGADMLVANRYGIRAASDSHRVALTSLMQQMVRLSTGYNLTDAVCGTRAYNLQLASIFAANVRSFCYGLEIEQLILASRKLRCADFQWNPSRKAHIPQPKSLKTTSQFSSSTTNGSLPSNGRTCLVLSPHLRCAPRFGYLVVFGSSQAISRSSS
jgi:hypothetical protein